MSIKELIDKSNIPEHVAIIMDGNGRWAKSKDLQRNLGHKEGRKTVKSIMISSIELGVKYLTVYAFSTENWFRPQDEVSNLMSLLINALDTELEEINKNGVRLLAIGQLNKLPFLVRQKLNQAIKTTQHNTKLNFVLALSYSGRWDVSNAVQNIAQACVENKLSVKDITEDTITQYLSTSKFPDPDLLIRTGGEWRISNFLLYQLAYSELYFTPVLWPDFTKEDYYSAILDYQKRERRYGQTSEQIINNIK